MPFTVLVKKRRKNEQFSFKDIKIVRAIHEDCGNEKSEIKLRVKTSVWGWSWKLRCQRCDIDRYIGFNEKSRIRLVGIVVNGGEIEFRDGEDKDTLRVISTT